MRKIDLSKINKISSPVVKIQGFLNNKKIEPDGTVVPGKSHGLMNDRLYYEIRKK